MVGSGGMDTDWRQRYLELADRSERAQTSHAEAERMLSRLIARLCVATHGLDAALDPHLERLRRAARAGNADKLLAQADDIADALVRETEQRTRPGVLQQLLEYTGMQQREADEVRSLWSKLAVDPAAASEQQLDRLVALLGQPAQLPSADRPAAAPGLFSRLIGRAGSEAAVSPNRLLLKVLKAVPWPNSVQPDVDDFRSTLSNDGDADAWVGVVRQISDLAIRALDQAQHSARSAETFLTDLNQRLELLGRHMLDEVQRREDARLSGEELGQRMNSEVVTLSDSVRQSADLAELQAGVLGSLERMNAHVLRHLDAENGRRAEAQGEAAQLRRQLHRLERDTFDLRRQVAQTRQEAICDPLTGLPNRRAYDERIAQEVARWKRFGDPLTLLIWDIDDFKRVNDTFGHKSGDKALVMIGRILSERLRETDFLARFGGEEFVLLLAGAAQDDALRFAEGLRLAVEKSGLHAHGKPVRITVSGGLAQFAEGDTADQVFERADRALYQAKRQGKNCCVVA